MRQAIHSKLSRRDALHMSERLEARENARGIKIYICRKVEKVLTLAKCSS